MIDQDPKILQLLDEIVAMELGGVLRFTHYSLMVTGPYRIPIVEFMQGQATEALAHAQRAGEILTGLGGHPTMHVSAIEETGKHST
ncbi:MAG: bacterioferritin, partial [Planctomycetota bacterium]